MFVILGLMLSILIIFIITVIVVVVYALIQYVFDSIFLYRVTKKQKGKGNLLGWIPFYNKVILGRIAGKELVGWLVFVFHIVNLCLSTLLYLMYKTAENSYSELVFSTIVIIVIINFILNMVMFHSIMKRVTAKYVDLLIVFNVFTFGLFKSIILFLVRDNERILSSVKDS